MKNRIINILWSWINSIYYSGNNVFCGLCNWRGSTFINNYCPNCKSLPRNRLIAYCLQNFNKNRKILHIGPNYGEYLFISSILKPSVYHRVDTENNRYINKVHDITKIGLNTNYYDLIIIWHVLEHIEKDIDAITNLYDSLQSNGILLASVPIYPAGNNITFQREIIKLGDNEKYYGHQDHVRACGYDYIDRFEKVGFKDINTVDALNIPQIDKKKFGLIDHIAWICKK